MTAERSKSPGGEIDSGHFSSIAMGALHREEIHVATVGLHSVRGSLGQGTKYQRCDRMTDHVTSPCRRRGLRV